MRYYIHIPLPEKLKDKILKIERKYQGDSGSEPHITLIPPRELLSGKSKQELIDAVYSVTQELIPLAIIRKNIGFFEDKKIIFVNIERTDGLVSLREALLKATSGILEPQDGPFSNLPTPHITLATRLSLKRGQKTWEVLKDINFYGQFICNRVTLLQKGQNDKYWKILSNFNLNG